jgi:hypothetical protein
MRILFNYFLISQQLLICLKSIRIKQYLTLATNPNKGTVLLSPPFCFCLRLINIRLFILFNCYFIYSVFYSLKFASFSLLLILKLKRLSGFSVSLGFNYSSNWFYDFTYPACCVLRAACCVLRAACCVLRAACCVIRPVASLP